MKEINRSVLVVRAKEPFLHWLRSLPDPEDCTLEELNEEPSAFLLPEYEDDRRRDYLLGKYFERIFEEELSCWWINRYWLLIRKREHSPCYWLSIFSILYYGFTLLPIIKPDFITKNYR